MSDSNLIEAPKKRTGLIVAIGVVVLVLIAAGVFALTRGGDEDTVRIGVVGASDPYWETYKEAAADEGIDVEIVDFAEYTQPNPALAAGDLDLNQFQHIVYLADYNVNNDEDLVPIGTTAIYPLGLYSLEYGDVEEIPDGETVAVPNDATNQARALVLLQSAGLIELTDGGTAFSDLADVDTAASRVEVTALNAEITAASLQDVAAAVINNDFVENAGLSFDDAIYEDSADDPDALPYVNIFVARAEDEDNETYAKLVEIYQDSQDVLDGVQDVSGGTAEFVKTPIDELKSTLADAEQDVRDNQ